MRTPEFIQRCMDAGLDLQTALKAAKAFEAECQVALEELLDARRSKERARQAKHRAQKAEADNAGNVMSRDKTLDDVTTVSERDLTYVGAQVVTPSSSLRSEAYTPVSPNGLTAPGGAETARGSRLPESWNPDLEAAAQLGLSMADAQVEADKFRDYWRAVPGAKGRKTNWPATWRNWCRTAAERKPNTRKAHERPHHDDRLSRKQANLARAFAGSERAAGFRGEP